MLRFLSAKQIDWLSRIALFLIFFWFGVIKVFRLSPAEELVKTLYSATLAGTNTFSLDGFVVFLGLVECLIGLGWLVPRYTKLTLWIFSIQMFTTFGPLVFLPAISWQAFALPTLTGQYILKNVSLVALALQIAKKAKA